MSADSRIAYKLTDSDGYTRRGKSGETLWGVGATVHPTGQGDRPCGPGVLHANISPEVAVLGDPIHGCFGPNARLFRVRAEQPWQTDGLKRWTRGPVEVLEELSLPVLTTEERIAWMIVHCPHPSTRVWAVSWLSGANRSEATARAAAAWAAWTRAAAAEAAWARAAAEAAAAMAARAEAEAWARAAAEAAAAMAARAEAEAWAAAAWAAWTRAAAAGVEVRLPRTLARARAILAGQWPAGRAWDDLEVPDAR